ncbi:putative membrane protein YccC [Pseudarthrobacter oxydans]|uniref:Membrane protein YccC n=1 Tax=Pseudarthrobacter oxydans TaxID=1671 RepID=A0AAW8NJU7_PSEOX|nr:FUSC family protein [Pseudarthrobacter oxydans]MDR7166203.1 putative membrane protein YccC [Pseudarthrobacter oxydans]
MATQGIAKRGAPCRCTKAKGDHPRRHWAMAAAAVPLAAANVASGIYRGIHRIVGTFLGLFIVAFLLLPSPWQLDAQKDVSALVMTIILFQFSTELFMMRRYGVAMVSFTPVILLVTQLAAPVSPYVLIVERGVETLIGAIVGIVVLISSGQDGQCY